ncbi:MAG: hypothetical protein WCL32_15340 [Planctomycetota bacterium]|jgi:Spy/CpxP family protein refolding chaperone
MRKMTITFGLFVAALGLVGVASGQIRVGGGQGAGRDPIQLLSNASVKKELELTDEQEKALPEAMLKALSGVLSDKQYKRFKQIELQQRGSGAFVDPKVQEALKLNDAQKDSIKTIIEDSRKEMRDLLQGGGFGKGAGEKIEGARKEAMEKVTGVLSSDQKKSWREMTGDSFKVEMPAFGGFGKKKAPQ